MNGAEIEPVDVVTGGSPCQDLSVAGKRAGLDGERSGLFMEEIRVVKEMRANDIRNGRAGEFIRPRFHIWENVPGALSSNNGEDFQVVLTEFIRVADPNAPDVPLPPNGKWPKFGGYMGEGPNGRWSVAYKIHDAQYWGVPQRRRRLCVIGDYGGWTAHRILFDPQYGRETESAESDQTVGDSSAESEPPLQSFGESLPGNTEQGGTAGQGTAPGTERGVGGAISFQERAGKPGGGKGILIQDEHTGALSTLNIQNVLQQPYGISSYASNSMKSPNPYSGVYKAETSRTLDLNGGFPGCNQGGIAVVAPIEGNGSRESHRGNGFGNADDPMFTLNGTEHHAVAYGVTTKGNGDAFISAERHTSLSTGGGEPGQGYPCVLEHQPTYVDTSHADDVTRISDVVAPLQNRDAKGGKLVLAFTQNQRDEVRDLNDVASGVSAEPGTHQTTYVATAVDVRNSTENSDVNGTLQAKSSGGWNANSNYVVRTSAVAVDVYNQTIDGEVAASLTAASGGSNTSGPKIMAAGFSFGQSANARSLGYELEKSPTLRGGEGGNQKPVVLAVDEE